MAKLIILIAFTVSFGVVSCQTPDAKKETNSSKTNSTYTKLEKPMENTFDKTDAEMYRFFCFLYQG